MFTLRDASFFYSIVLEVGGASVAQSRVQSSGVVKVHSMDGIMPTSFKFSLKGGGVYCTP